VAGPQLQTTAFVLGRQPSSADAFEQLSIFSENDGLLLCLRRQTTKNPANQSTPLDLFDEAEFWLESSNEGRTWFIREHRHIARHSGTGRSYEALQAAAAMAQLVQRNPVPDESRAPIAALLRQGLQALDRGARPDVVWLKALFCFLRDEGYPVKQHWWQQLEPADRELAAAVLNRPIAGQELQPADVQRLTGNLVGWIRSDTELHVQ
jgi:recombinational DNA repair protein (RecF pathway)